MAEMYPSYVIFNPAIVRRVCRGVVTVTVCAWRKFIRLGNIWSKEGDQLATF
jgi:hypothetical protein